MPFDRLKNTEFKALTGRAHGPKVVTGALGATRADGQIVQGPRYIAFKGPDTRLVFDLNPKGLSTGMDYGGGGFIGRWTVTKKGDFVEFSVGINASFFGGTFAAKALIYEGEYAFSKAHPIGKLAYFDIYPSTAQYCFGTASAPEGWTKLDTAAYGGRTDRRLGKPHYGDADGEPRQGADPQRRHGQRRQRLCPGRHARNLLRHPPRGRRRRGDRSTCRRTAKSS